MDAMQGIGRRTRGDVMQHKENVLRGAIFSFIIVFLATSFGFANAVEDSIHIAMPNRPKSLNYFDATDAWSQKVLRLFHMSLYIKGPANKKMIPWLAESLPVPGDRPNSVTIRLRKAQWDDGTSVTVEDLIFTVKTIQEFKVPGHLEKWQDVARMEALNERTLRFTLKGPSPGFFKRALFAPFVQKKRWSQVVLSARAADNPLKTFMAFQPQTVSSNGPFFLQTYTEPFFMVLKENPHFFGRGHEMDGILVGPYLSTVILEFNSDVQKSLNELAKGKIDFIWWDLPLDFVPQISRIPHVTLYGTDRTGYDYLTFNLERIPYTDPSFRRSVALLVDRDQIVRRVLKGQGTPVYSVIPPQNTFWSNPHVTDPGAGLTAEERVNQAKIILQKAGYSWVESHLILPDGQKMKPMEILTTRGWHRPFRLKVALMIKKALSKIGIPVSTRMQSLHQTIALLRKGDFDTCIMGWANLSDDPDYLKTFFHSAEALPGGKNHARFRNTTFDEMSEKASWERDSDQRQALVFHMQALIAKEVPCIPLYTGPRVEAARNDHFQGWVKMSGGIGNLWSFVHLKPIKSDGEDKK
jgi:peptide/nickel transport system substrate-binding protein